MQVLQELGWRAAYGIFLSGAIAREVRSTYTDPSSPKLRNLRTSAQIAWGLKPGNSVQHRARTRVAHKAQLKLEQGKWQLGQVPVGFEDLVIEARATNQNSSRVYLDGFDESLSVFNIYKQVLRPGAVAIDVGANVGIHSLVMSRCVCEQGHVYSYEPGPDIARMFLENVALNGAGNITLRQHGLGSEPGFMRFEMDYSNLGKSRFTVRGDLTVPVSTLDSEHPDGDVDLIKIDVEGMELKVLQGAGRLLARSRPVLVLEWNDWTYEQLTAVIPYCFNLSLIPFNPNEPLMAVKDPCSVPQGANVLLKLAR